MKKSCAFLLGLILLLPAAMLAAVNAAGVWEGSISTPDGDVGVVVNLHKDGDKWAAEVDVPIQSVSGLPLGNVKVEGSTVSFSMPGPGNPGFEGKLSADGKTLTGTLNHGDANLPLEFKWKSEPKVVAKEPANTGDVQFLEGVWEGAIDVHGNKLHLRFNFTRNADGTIAGTLDSVDQGTDGIPIVSIARTGDTVKLDIKSIAGAFEGTLNKDMSVIGGEWSQATAKLPLSIERQKPAKK